MTEETTLQNDTEFVSLGDHCMISLYMKKFGFKSCSYPFDWIISNLDIITHILLDDFDLFLNDSSKYTLTSGKMFVHHNITRDRYYFQRCIKRFRNLATKKTIFFLSICHTGGNKHTHLADNHRKYIHEDFKRLLDIIQNVCNITNARLVVIYILPEEPIEKYTMVTNSIDIYRYKATLNAAILDRKTEAELHKLFIKYIEN